MTDPEVVDRSALDRLREWGGDRLLEQMIRLFLENSPERLEQIRRGLEEGPLSVAERGAHSLKSSAANVGAREVSRIAQEMEDAASEGDGDRVHELQPFLVEAHGKACAALGEHQKGVSE